MDTVEHDTTDVEIQLDPTYEPASATCEKCGTVYYVGQDYRCPHADLFPLPAQGFEPVVIHEAKDGRVRFPGHVSAVAPEGFMRRELRTVAEVRAFQRRINTSENSKIARKNEIDCEALERMEHDNRRELRSRMESMSPAQRAFAQYAIDRNNNRRPKSGDAGFHLDAFEYDRSNREEYRDAKTNWRPGRR